MSDRLDVSVVTVDTNMKPVYIHAHSHRGFRKTHKPQLAVEEFTLGDGEESSCIYCLSLEINANPPSSNFHPPFPTLMCVSLPWFVWRYSAGRGMKVKHMQVNTLVSSRTHAHTTSTVTQTAVSLRRTVSCLVIPDWKAERCLLSLHTILPAFATVLLTSAGCVYACVHATQHVYSVFAKGGQEEVCVWKTDICEMYRRNCVYVEEVCLCVCSMRVNTKCSWPLLCSKTTRLHFNTQ